MKLVIKILLIALICYIAQLYLPFWIVAVVSLLINVSIKTSTFSSFLSGFLGTGILWLIMSIYIDQSTNGILTERIANLLTVNTPILIIVTAVIGGLVSGFAGMTGSLLISSKKSRSGQYYS